MFSYSLLENITLLTVLDAYWIVRVFECERLRGLLLDMLDMITAVSIFQNNMSGRGQHEGNRRF